MTICYFGDYNKDYTRTKVIIKGLEQAGVRLIHCNEGGGGLDMYRRLWKKHQLLRGKYDLIFIGTGNSRYMPIFARLLTIKPVVWEPLYSAKESLMEDRQYIKPYSLRGLKLRLLDWINCKISNLVILDTKTHAEYFMKTFSLSADKVDYAHVGADPEMFYPKDRTEYGVFEVEFHGKYIPVHGTERVIRAAKLLEYENIHFTMIGAGQEELKIKKLAKELKLKNVSFVPFLPIEEVTEYIRNSDVCMAMLGNVTRIERSIPNKMWEAAAMARVSANINSSSLREVFTPGTDAIGVELGGAEDLARAIKELKDSGKSREMGWAAYQTYLKFGRPEVIGKNLVKTIKRRFTKLT